MRLTSKLVNENSNDYLIETSGMLDEKTCIAINKLGQLEDIEEEYEKNGDVLTSELKDTLSKLKEIKLDVDEETAMKIIETNNKFKTSLDWKLEPLCEVENEKI